MKKYLVCMLTAVMLMLVVSCHRQKLEEPYMYLSHIPVSIDWDESLLDMKQVGNVSLYFYPKNGGEPIVKVSDDLYYNLIELPIGEYSVLIFNDMINNVVGVSYLDEKVYDNFSVNMREKVNHVPGFYEPASEEVFVTPHSRMAGWSLGELVVDESLVEYTRSEEFKDYIAAVKSRAETRRASSKGSPDLSGEDTKATRIPMPECSVEITKASEEALEELSNISMQPRTTVIQYRVRVVNLNSAMTFKVFMKGSATGVSLAHDENIPADDTRNVYDLTVANREYDNPDKGIDGYVNFSLNTFGREPRDEKYELSFRVVLQTGELKEFERDITEQMKSQDGHVININLSTDDELLTLPEYTKAGFNVNGWGDDITIYL